MLAQHRTDRLDTPAQATGLPVACVLADELHDHRDGRSSSAAKKLEAARLSREWWVGWAEHDIPQVAAVATGRLAGPVHLH
jgi:hypothetical protein